MERILVGLDASPRASSVLAAAVGLARALGAKLILFRGVGIPVELPREAYSLSPDALAALLESQARRYLEELAATLPPELVAGIDVAVGTPWQSICAAAERDKVDLIAIGSHGYNALDRVLGTTAAKVVNHARCSVLVVRAPAPA